MKHFLPLPVLSLWTSLLIAMLCSCGGGDSGPAPLSIVASSPPAGTSGEAYAGYTFIASGGTPPYSWSESGPLPPGLQLDTSGQLGGDTGTAGTYPIIVGVTDSSGRTANVTVSLQVKDSAIVIAAASPPAGTLTHPYSFGFTANGGSPPYTWKSSGTVPPGLTLGSDGTVSGTPTQLGTFAFSVTATDSAQQPMNSPALATQIVINIPTKLTLNADPAPPAGVDGTDYGVFNFSTTGGYLPLQWSITAGNLPPGLTLGSDGSLSGTPTGVGSFTFTVMATDSGAKPVSSSLAFTINVTLPPPPTVDGQEAPTGTVGAVYAPYSFTATGGVAPLAWSETPPLNMGLSLDTQGVLSGTPTSAGQFAITLNVIDAASQSAGPFPTIVRVSLARPAATFTPTKGSMTIARSGHSATLLLTGKVLVTGGGNGGPDATAELYDPATQSFAPTAGTMTEARSGQTATLLANNAVANYGKVLIVGSADSTAELYDPVSSTFAATGSMHHARTAPTATLLSSGKVLIAGGNTNSGNLVAELYDPASGSFSDTGSTTIARAGHTATLLLNGQVLIAGGGTATAELYDSASGTFSPTAGDMTEGRTGHTATLLGAADGVQNGDVLIIGTSGSADLYDPGTRTFKRVGSFEPGPNGYLPVFAQTASLRKDGTVLAAGGDGRRRCGRGGSRAVSSSSAALFAPESDGFTITGSLNTSRDTHTATVLQDGTVLIVGGTHHSNLFFICGQQTTVLSSAELFK